jgi:hypothetical protein
LVRLKWAYGIARNIGPIINLYAYFKFLFSFSHLLFQTDVLLLFSSKDMSRNATLKIISEYFLDKRLVHVETQPLSASGLG